MTKRKMFLKMIANSLLRRRSRILIAILAIAVGATILFGLLTIYYDIPRQLGKEFRSYGANLVVLPNGDEPMNAEDLEQIKIEIGKKNIVGLAPYRYWTCKINEQPYMLAGTNLEEAKKNSPFWYVEGRWVNNGEMDKVMVGKEIAKKLALNIGDSIIVKGVKYGERAESSDQNKSAEENKEREFGAQNFSKKLYVEGIVTTGGAEEGFIFLDINSLSEIVEDGFKADIIECSIEANKEELDLIAGNIDKSQKFMARPVRRVTQSQDQVLSKLKSLVFLVTLVILIITMISVTTTMMAMVAERKVEIGLKKALGATNKTITNEFMAESAVLGIIGGILGVVLGYIFAKEVSLSVFGRMVDFQPLLAPFAIIASVIISALASIWPVRKVLEIDPAIVLKGE